METFSTKIESVKETLKANNYRLYCNIKYKDGSIRKKKLFLSTTNTICEFMPHSRKRGYVLNYDYIEDIVPIISKKREISKEEQFIKDCDKVLKHLLQSGWWSDFVGGINFLKSIGYETAKRYNDLYWSLWEIKDSEEKEKARNSIPTEFQHDLFAMIDNCKIEKMYFGAYNDSTLADIAQRTSKGMKCSVDIEGGKWSKLSYDTSFEYNPELKKAWYSKEYRGCGNGHYYLALSPTHAIYYEDD